MKNWIQNLDTLARISKTTEKATALKGMFGEGWDTTHLEAILDLSFNYKINTYLSDLKALGRGIDSFDYAINHDGANPLVGGSETYFFENIYTRLKEGNLKFAHNSSEYRFSKGEWIDTLINLATRCHSIREFDYYVQAITKDLRIGMQAKSINKVYEKLNSDQNIVVPLIPCYECMKVSDMDDAPNFKYDNSYASVKMDGANATYIDGKIYSRNGLEIHLPHIQKAFAELQEVVPAAEDYVFCGELVSTDRQSSGGLVNSAITTGEASTKDLSVLNFHIFDIIRKDEYEQQTGIKDIFTKRLMYIVQFKAMTSPRSPIRYVMHYPIYSKEEAETMYEKLTTEDPECEGIIVNEGTSYFEFKRSKTRIRVKAKLENEFKILGFEPHLRNKEWVGALKISCADGKILADVGTGLTEEDRATLFQDPNLFGKIVKIQYNKIIPNSNGDGHTLFLPVFKELRLDKTEADKFDL